MLFVKTMAVKDPGIEVGCYDFTKQTNDRLENYGEQTPMVITCHGPPAWWTLYR